MTQRILEEAKQHLREVEDGIATMQAKYRECVSKKEELEMKCEQCEQRLGRADKVCAPLQQSLQVRQEEKSFFPWALPIPFLAPDGQGQSGQSQPQASAQSPRAHTIRLFLQLINGLSDEKVRWQETVENLENMLDNISGDVLVAAGFVAYLGPFTVKSPKPTLDPLYPSHKETLPRGLPSVRATCGVPLLPSLMWHADTEQVQVVAQVRRAPLGE